MKKSVKNLILAGLAVPLLTISVFTFAGEGKTERIAVAASGNTPPASVSAQAGRAPFFLFFDRQGTFIEAVGNPYKDAGSAGISTVDFLAAKGVTVLVAEGYGPRIVEVMKGKGMRAVTFTGTAADAVKKLVGAR